jgi:hypothetical protein
MSELKWVEREFESVTHPGQMKVGHVAVCSCGTMTFIVCHLVGEHIHFMCPTCEENYCSEEDHHESNGPKPQA